MNDKMHETKGRATVYEPYESLVRVNLTVGGSSHAIRGTYVNSGPDMEAFGSREERDARLRELANGAEFMPIYLSEENGDPWIIGWDPESAPIPSSEASTMSASKNNDATESWYAANAPKAAPKERALPSKAARDEAINLLVSAARELEHAENHGRYGDGRDITVAQVLRERMAELRAFIPTREDDDK